MMNKKKVLILINELLRGGAQRIVLDIAKNIDKNEFDLHVVYMKSHNVFKGDADSLLADLQKTGVKISCLEGKQKFSWKEVKRFQEIVQKERPDIVHTFLPYAGVVGRVVAKFNRVPHIVSTQCNLPVAYSRKIYWLDKITLHLADAWTAATHGIEQSYGGSIANISEETWNHGRRHFTVYGGVDVETIQQKVAGVNKIEKRKSLNIPADAKVIMMTARLISWKGHDDLIKAVALLPKEFHLLLVGWGPLEAELKMLAEAKGVTNRVHFLGARSDVYELFAIADMYAQTHSRAPNGDIWMGPNLSQLEAAAAKVPSVSTNVPLIEYFIKDKMNGVLAEPNNPESLQAAILWASSHPTEVQAMTESLAKYVSDIYSLKSMVRQYETVYTLVAASKIK